MSESFKCVSRLPGRLHTTTENKLFTAISDIVNPLHRDIEEHHLSYKDRHILGRAITMLISKGHGDTFPKLVDTIYDSLCNIYTTKGNELFIPYPFVGTPENIVLSLYADYLIDQI